MNYVIFRQNDVFSPPLKAIGPFSSRDEANAWAASYPAPDNVWQTIQPLDQPSRSHER
jgi:hypothetical protein